MVEQGIVEVGSEPSKSLADVLGKLRVDDGSKGSYLVLRVSGIGQTDALKILRRKYGTYLGWRGLDPEFASLDNRMNELVAKYQGQAKMLRTALVDSLAVELGIQLMRRAINREQIGDGGWTYITAFMKSRATAVTGIPNRTDDNWDRIASLITNKVPANIKREMELRSNPDGSQQLTISEQRQMRASTPSIEVTKVVDVGDALEVFRRSLNNGNNGNGGGSERVAEG